MTLAELLDRGDLVRERFCASLERAIESLGAGSSADDSRWTPAQVAMHAALAESLTAKLLGRLAEKAHSRGRLSMPAPKRLPLEADLRTSMPRYDAFDVFPQTEPDPEVTVVAALRAMDRSHQALHATVHEFEAYDCASIVAPHPAAGRMNYYEWVQFVPTHEELHELQLRELIERRSPGAQTR